MARTRTSLVVLMLLFAVTLAAAQSDFNTARDWSATANPNGAWTFGSKAGGLSGTFVPYTTYVNPATGFAQRDEWTGGGGASAVFHNTVGLGGDFPPSMVVLRPDATTPGYIAMARWTAPAAGAYVLQGQFNALNTSHAGVVVMVNTAITRSSTLTGTGSSFPFTVYVNAVVGTRVDFLVRPSGSGDDSTGLDLSVHQLQLNRSGAGAPATVLPFNNVQITNNTFQAGTAWTAGQQGVASGFDTTFNYQINAASSPAGEGFTFTVQNDPMGPAYLGANGTALAIDGLTHALVFKFDDNVADPSNPAAPHLAVMTGGSGAMNAASECSPAPCSLGGVSTLGRFNFANYATAFAGSHQARVKYVVGSSPTLYVFLDSAAGGNGVLDGNAPVLTLPFDLAAQLALSNGATIGFTGGTSANWQQVQIWGWQFVSLDTVPPVISTASDITLEANQLGGAYVSYTSPTAMDSQDGPRPVNCTPNSGELFAVGTTQVTCSASDLSGNTAQSAFNVTVTDTTPPALSLPADMSGEAAGPAGLAVTYVATATDIVDGNVTPVCAPASGTTFPLGMTTVNCSVSDAHNNKATGSFTVTVVDTKAPVLSGMPSNMTLEATGANGAVATWTAPTASDLVDSSVAVLCNPASGSTFALTTTSVTCSATDASGNSSSASFNVTVQDTTAPAISGMPANMMVEASSASGAVANWTMPTASDLVDGSVTVACAPASGSSFPFGTTAVNCSATDAHGNKASASFNVTVQDTTAPAISGMPANMIMEASSATGAVANWTMPTASDLVDGSVTVACSPASGSNFPLGTTAVNCSATDAHGNKASASFNVTVQDTTAPSLSGMPSNMTLEATSPSGAAAAWTMPTASDLVDGSVAVACAPASGSTFPLGTTAVTCSATDAHGNKASGSFSVTVRDTTAPALTLPANMTVNASSSSGVVVNFTASASDLVDGSVAVLCSPASGSNFAVGTTPVNCSATDAHGNSAQGSFSVTVNAPVTSSFTIRLLYDPNQAKQPGSTYPLVLQVMNANGQNVSSPSLILTAAGVQALDGGTPGPLQSAGGSNDDMQFRYDSSFRGYIFNLKLDGYSAGSFALMFGVGNDGSAQAAPFTVRDDQSSSFNGTRNGNARGRKDDDHGKDKGKDKDKDDHGRDRDNDRHERH